MPDRRTNQDTNQPPNRQTDRRIHREVTRPSQEDIASENDGRKVQVTGQSFAEWISEAYRGKKPFIEMLCHTKTKNRRLKE